MNNKHVLAYELRLRLQAKNVFQFPGTSIIVFLPYLEDDPYGAVVNMLGFNEYTTLHATELEEAKKEAAAWVRDKLKNRLQRLEEELKGYLP